MMEDEFAATPDKPFYIVADQELDGTVSLMSEGKEARSLEDAIGYARCIVDEYGGVQYVIECRCIRKVEWAKTWKPQEGMRRQLEDHN